MTDSPSPSIDTLSWQQTSLGELCELRAGSTFPRPYQGKPSGEYPFIKVSDMNRTENSVLIQGANNWVDDADLSHLKAKPFLPGTTVFAKIGEALKQNRLRLLIRPTVIDNNMMGATPNASLVNPRYFYYALSQFDFAQVAGGTALPYLTVGALSSLTLRVPPLSEQRAIAHVLGTLDAKIELNRRMNETLEQIAKTLFKSWFVNFDPVRAKMGGRWHPGESLPGLPSMLYRHFSDQLVESRLGLIPQGWPIRNLASEFQVIMGQSPPGDTYNNHGEGLPFYQGSGDFGVRFPNRRRYCTRPKRIAEANDTMVSVRAPVGDVNMAWERCCVGRGLAVIRHKAPSPSYSYYTVHALLQRLHAHQTSGTVFGAITKRQLASLPVLVPSRELVRAFEEVVNPWDKRLRLNVSNITALTEQRNFLTQALIAGTHRSKGLHHQGEVMWR